MNFLLSPEYEKLKEEKQQKAQKEKEEELKKLQRDIGEGEPVAMEADCRGAQAFDSVPVSRFHLSLGTDLDSDDEAEKDSEEEWNDEEIKEQESFKRFLDKEKEKQKRTTAVNKEEQP